MSVYDIVEHRDSKYYKQALEEGIRSILSIPVRSQEEVIGVLRMYTTEPVKYTEEDLRFMSAIAEQGAIAIENATMYEKIKNDYDIIMRYLDGAVLEKE